jgi:uncharacterized phiE125 gp8 family phage protein
MPLTRIVDPTVEPITLAEAKSHLRVIDNDDDSLIIAMIKAVRSIAEDRTRRSLCLQTWRATLDAFPGPSLMGVPAGIPYSLPRHAIILERPPIQSITSIQYVAMDGTTQSMPTTDFVDLTVGGTIRVDDPCRITPQFGKIWPVTLPQIGAVSIVYTTGYSTDPSAATQAAAVPDAIKAWMKLRLAALYENREEFIVDQRIVLVENPFVDSLLDPHIVELF